MKINDVFPELVKFHRVRQGLSQEALADRAGLDRTYISQLEHGHKSPTLTTLDKLASCLSISGIDLVSDTASPNQNTPLIARDYQLQDACTLHIRRDHGVATISSDVLLDAIDTAHCLIDEIYSIDLDIAKILGLRNLSAFFGELLSEAVFKTSDGLLCPNPHQDGYPDLLLMDKSGRMEWDRLRERLNEKSPFSPFPGGGIEVKATCGSIPSPAQCRQRGFERPALGDTRIHCATGYDWKAHHKETNNLAGVLWDFVAGHPRVTALFYSSDLGADDWGEIVKPKSGGGRTTSLSIMKPSGIRKMYEGWLCVLSSGGYAEFINRKNRGSLIPTK